MSLIQLNPALKDYIWGGRRLKEEFGLGRDMDRVAEAWMLSAHPQGMSMVRCADGGQRAFADFLAALSPAQLGSGYDAAKPFPLLIKLIDAAQALSVQVHPDDTAAAPFGDNGKTEMWYVADCDLGAYIYRGVRPGVTRARFEAALAEGTVCELLVKVPVEKGGAYFIPAGTVHAIGAGCLICEVQQSSDITYRVYDYGRRDAEGNTRPLHIRQALDVIDFSGKAALSSPPPAERLGQPLCGCAYFNVYRYTVAGQGALPLNGTSFLSLVALCGAGTLHAGESDLPYQKGDSFFATADSGRVALTGDGTFIVTTL